MDHEEMGCEGVDWIRLVQDRDRCWVLVNTLDLRSFIVGGGLLNCLIDYQLLEKDFAPWSDLVL
jgi:hypothetical protein